MNAPGAESRGDVMCTLGRSKLYMWLRLYSVVILTTLTGLCAFLGWLLQLPMQLDLVYDLSDSRFVLLGYVDFVFLLIIALTIVLIITRSHFDTALQKVGLSQLDRNLYRLMFSLPLILICLLCAVVIFVVFAVSLSLGIDFSTYDWQPGQ
jgi:amino acid transporter